MPQSRSVNHLRIIGKKDGIMRRFWDKVKISKSCWNWQACKKPTGYGLFKTNKKLYRAHRFLYEKIVEQIPLGLELDHICNNPSCVNPNHLIISTHRNNTLRSNNITAQNSRKTHCKHGHELIFPNMRIKASGSRECKICQRILIKKWKQKQ